VEISIAIVVWEIIHILDAGYARVVLSSCSCGQDIHRFNGLRFNTVLRNPVIASHPRPVQTG